MRLFAPHVDPAVVKHVIPELASFSCGATDCKYFRRTLYVLMLACTDRFCTPLQSDSTSTSFVGPATAGSVLQIWRPSRLPEESKVVPLKQQSANFVYSMCQLDRGRSVRDDLAKMEA